MTQPLPPLDCKQTVRALWDYLDGRVRKADADAIDEHLARCAGCRSHFSFEGRLKRELAALRGTHPNPEGLRRRVLGVLAGAGYTGD